MIRELRLGGFKGFRDDQCISLAPVTLLYGQNSSGKSSILQSLAMLRQSCLEGSRAAEVVTTGSGAALGEFENLVFARDPDRVLTLGMTYTDVESARLMWRRRRLHYPVAGQERSVDLTFRGHVFAGRGHRSGAVVSVRYGLGPEPSEDRGALLDATLVRPDADLDIDEAAMDGAEFLFKDERSSQSAAMLLQQIGRRLSEEPRGGRRLGTRHLAESALADLTKALAQRSVRPSKWLPDMLEEPGEQNPAFGLLGDGEPILPLPHLAAQVLPVLTEDIYSLVRAVHYLGPMRRQPERLLISNDAQGGRSTIGPAGEYFVEYVSGTPELEAIVNDWLTRLEVPYSLNLIPVGSRETVEAVAMVLVDQRTGVRVGPSAVGFGIAQVLPVLLAGEVGGIVCVEQPELHLHPRVQGNLADFFVATSDCSVDIPAPRHPARSALSEPYRSTQPPTQSQA